MMQISPPLPRFILLYAAMFAAFGVASPFLPGLLRQDGLSAAQLSFVLAAGTAVRLATGPLGGRVADRSGRGPLVIAVLAAMAAVVALGYGPARGLAALLLVSVVHAAVLAPLTPVADALATRSAQEAPGFDYGWVRGAGSAAFIAGTLISGRLVERLGLDVVIWLNAALLAMAACLALVAPNRLAAHPAELRDHQDAGAGWRTLLSNRVFMWMMATVALIGASHAMHDGFEVIRWRDAGLSAEQASWLWSMSVAAEVAVFFVFGRVLLEWLGPGGAAMLAAAAGVVRWGAAAETARFEVMALVEPLHGLTFALLHLACMDVIGKSVPPRLAATAQAFYGTVAMGVTPALVTLASGPLYGRFGASAFWTMAGMCGLAMPLALTVRQLGRRMPTSL